MVVYHRGIHVLMTNEFLDSSDIMSRLKKMRSEAMPQHVTACVLRNIRFS